MCTNKRVNSKYRVSWGVERKGIGAQLGTGWQEMPARIRGWRRCRLSLSLSESWLSLSTWSVSYQPHKMWAPTSFNFTKAPLMAYVYVRGSLCIDRGNLSASMRSSRFCVSHIAFFICLFCCYGPHQWTSKPMSFVNSQLIQGSTQMQTKNQIKYWIKHHSKK